MKSFGIIGLGVMGRNLALNLIEKGFGVSVYNRELPPHEVELARKFQIEHTSSEGYDQLEAFVHSLEKPRKILLMVNAGKPVDEVIGLLLSFLEPGDLLMDGGNSLYTDTERRIQFLSEKNIHYLGIGISGGEEGARHGASIMPGGSEDGYRLAAPFLEKISAQDPSGAPCCSYVGPGGSGHFVKMVHNGIEYAEMQMIAEMYDAMKNLMDLSPINISDAFEHWNNEGCRSYLLEITKNILIKKENGALLLDKILDSAAQKGTGGWSTQIAIEMGIPLNTISEAVFARTISGLKKTRVEAAKAYNIPVSAAMDAVSFRQVKNAYHVARIINHHIGFAMLADASIEKGWNLNLPEIARLWTNGCIIRSELMEQLSKSMKKGIPILLQEEFIETVGGSWQDLSQLVSEGMQHGIAMPVISSSLNYFLAYVRENSVANLIQAQRDYFGAHTFKRTDQPEHLNFHADWKL